MSIKKWLHKKEYKSLKPVDITRVILEINIVLSGEVYGRN